MRFDSYHPAINFLYFAVVIAGAIAFNQPAFLLVSFVSAFVYSIALNGRRAAVFNTVLLPLIALFALHYSAYHHFGVTEVAVNGIGNRITLESMVYGLTLGARAAAVMMWFSCVRAVISSDKVIYLTGRVFPRVSLMMAAALRFVPRTKAVGRKIHLAQKCIGRGMQQGGLLARAANYFRIQSALVTWAIEDCVQKADSMRSRGYSLRGRTAFSIYRFDNRDRSFVIGLMACAMVVMMAVLLDQTRILYNPEIIMNRMTPLSGVFLSAYAVLCLLPLALQKAGEARFAALRRQEKAGKA